MVACVGAGARRVAGEKAEWATAHVESFFSNKDRFHNFVYVVSM